MAKVVLIHPPLDAARRYGEFAAVGNELPNLGLIYLAAFLREKGVPVSVIDAPALGLSHQQVAERVRTENPMLVGLTAATVAVSAAVRCAEHIRGLLPGVPIAIGGAHVSALPEKTLADYPVFDFGAVGEGELTLAEVVDALAGGRELATVAGLVVRTGKGIETTAPRPLIDDLDGLALPAWDLLPDLPSTYRPSPQSTFRLPSTILFTTRGCPFHCTFCDRSVFGNRVRSHSAKRVLEMMEHLYRTYGIVDFAFHDESFIFNLKRLGEFCEGLIESGLPLTWICQGRVDQDVPEDTLALMKRAGCSQLQFGIETANDPILELMKKGATVERIRGALARTKRAGISTKAFFMVGLFGETEQSLAATERFILEAPLDDVMISFFTPFPGSEAHCQVEQYGELIGAYDSMSEYEVVFIPRGLTAGILAEARKRMYRRFYLRPRIIGNYLNRMREPSARRVLARASINALRAFFG